MHDQEALTEISAVETLVGDRFPWLSTGELRHASEFLVERMQKYDIDKCDEYTPELREEAQATGRELAGMLRPAPAYGGLAASLAPSHFLDRVKAGIEDVGRVIRR